ERVGGWTRIRGERRPALLRRAVPSVLQALLLSPGARRLPAVLPAVLRAASGLLRAACRVHAAVLVLSGAGGSGSVLSNLQFADRKRRLWAPFVCNRRHCETS